MKRVTPQGTCPRCGSSNFVAKRTKRGVVTAGLLAPKRIRCVRCGESLKQGHGTVDTPDGRLLADLEAGKITMSEFLEQYRAAHDR